MSKFIIEGGHTLSGTITPMGAKNEALQIISASLLTPAPVTIHNIPEILDIQNLIALLRNIGVKVTRHAPGSYTFQADAIDTAYLNTPDYIAAAAALRGSILTVGPLLARLGHAWFPKPGGDKIGRRKIDTHISGLLRLGATAEYDPTRQAYKLTAPTSGLRGAYILLDEASVTGTANILMAATAADGPTTIYNAACEPYIQQLCRLLTSMGVGIDGIGSNLLTVHPARLSYGTQGSVTHTVLPDMIEVGSFIGMAALTRSTITIDNAAIGHLGIIPDTFRRLGIPITADMAADKLTVHAAEHYTVDTALDGSILTLADAPWPGLTPDLLSVLLVVATQCRGSVLIHQKMFESRLFFVDRLIDMGAQIILCDPHRAVVIGQDHRAPLRANKMTSPDIRAGIALLLAAMNASGISEIGNITQIDRGYASIDTRLTALGASIRRV